MQIIEKKKLFIENKKKDLSEKLLKNSLGSLLVDVNDVYERIEAGLNKIMRIDNLDDLFSFDNTAETVIIDIRNIDYSADLDKIAYAKRINENLCVISRDILLDAYQMYLSNMYNIDGILFDVEYIDSKELKEVFFLAGAMGIELIYGVKSESDLLKIRENCGDIRLVSPLQDGDFMRLIPDNVIIVKDIDSNFKTRRPYVEIAERKSYE